MLRQVSWSSSPCDQQSSCSDALASAPSIDDGETLVPPVSDVLMSLASLPSAASTADIPPTGTGTSAYVSALLDHMRPGVDVTEAMYKLNQQLSQRAPHIRTEVVLTTDRALVFPCSK